MEKSIILNVNDIEIGLVPPLYACLAARGVCKFLKRSGYHAHQMITEKKIRGRGHPKDETTLIFFPDSKSSSYKLFKDVSFVSDFF